MARLWSSHLRGRWTVSRTNDLVHHLVDTAKNEQNIMQNQQNTGKCSLGTTAPLCVALDGDVSFRL